MSNSLLQRALRRISRSLLIGTKTICYNSVCSKSPLVREISLEPNCSSLSRKSSLEIDTPLSIDETSFLNKATINSTDVIFVPARRGVLVDFGRGRYTLCAATNHLGHNLYFHSLLYKWLSLLLFRLYLAVSRDQEFHHVAVVHDDLNHRTRDLEEMTVIPVCFPSKQYPWSAITNHLIPLIMFYKEHRRHCQEIAILIPPNLPLPLIQDIRKIVGNDYIHILENPIICIRKVLLFEVCGFPSASSLATFVNFFLQLDESDE